MFLMPDKSFAVFDEDTGDQLSEWMSYADAQDWLSCAGYAQGTSYRQDRQYSMHIRHEEHWRPS
jgi:hypothetical protein